jgi:hypothetical protein
MSAKSEKGKVTPFDFVCFPQHTHSKKEAHQHKTVGVESHIQLWGYVPFPAKCQKSGSVRSLFSPLFVLSVGI